MKYNVDLDFGTCIDDIEAESEEDAIRQALIKITNNPNDFFTAEDHYANVILENFNNYSYATLMEEEEDE